MIMVIVIMSIEVRIIAGIIMIKVTSRIVTGVKIRAFIKVTVTTMMREMTVMKITIKKMINSIMIKKEEQEQA